MVLCMPYHHLIFYLLFFNSTATNVEIQLPVPSDATNPNIRTSMGSAAYAPENDALVWKIKSFPGNKVGLLFVSCTVPFCWAHGFQKLQHICYLTSWTKNTQEYMLRAEFSLPSITSEDATPDRKAPIRVKFEIPYFTVSGIQVWVPKWSYMRSDIMFDMLIISFKQFSPITMEDFPKYAKIANYWPDWIQVYHFG